MEELDEQQLDLTGKYKAFLRPMNTLISGFIPYGAAEIEVKEGDIAVVSYLDDDSQVSHYQSIFSGTECPTISSDMNGDGIIDITELAPLAGASLIPFDADLSSQKNGENIFPRGSSYTYRESANLQDLLGDLYLSDDNTSDNIMKLSPGKVFNIEGKVVIVFGTGDISRVPDSVKTFNALPRNLSVPIACGVIKRL